MYTNLESHGGNFRSVLDKEFKQSNDVAIASGYASLDVMEAFDSEFIAIAKMGRLF